MDDVDAGFYLLRPPPDGDLPPEGPTGVDDLWGHFSIRKIHDAVAAREVCPLPPSKDGAVPRGSALLNTLGRAKPQEGGCEAVSCGLFAQKFGLANRKA